MRNLLSKLIAGVLLCGTMVLGSHFTSWAAPEQMPDGTVFDADYYAANNPDVVAVLGTDKTILYNHYLTSGIREGRLPYDPNYFGPITIATPTPQQPAVNVTPRKATIGDKNALSKAKSYLRFTSFSYKGLIDQLKYEGFLDSEAQYGADYCGADWNEQALKKALSYLKYSSFSYNGLIEQLEYEGFTTAQAQYGVNNCGADWNEQAVKKAASYLKYSAFSKQGLIEQLEYEGFTHAQAAYGVAMNGY